MMYGYISFHNYSSKCIFSERNTRPNETNNQILDVKVPVQCLVKDSKMILHENTKVYSTIFFCE